MLRLRPYKPADAGYLMKWLEDERTVEFWKADRFCWPLTAVRKLLQNCMYGYYPPADNHAKICTN